MYKLHAVEVILTGTAQKTKFSIKNVFSKYDQMLQIWSHLNLRIWSHLLKKSVMENFIFCAERDMLLVLNKSLLQI